jgi:hypothetical protein
MQLRLQPHFLVAIGWLQPRIVRKTFRNRALLEICLLYFRQSVHGRIVENFAASFRRA